MTRVAFHTYIITYISLSNPLSRIPSHQQLHLVKFVIDCPIVKHHGRTNPHPRARRNRLHVLRPPSLTSRLISILTLSYHSGGSALTELLERNDARYTLSALVRKPYQASILADAGVKPLIFKDLDDFGVIRDAAKECDSMSSV